MKAQWSIIFLSAAVILNTAGDLIQNRTMAMHRQLHEMVTIEDVEIFVIPDESVDWDEAQAVLIGEAASEGELGMTWVACVMRNREWDLDGFSARRRKDLGDFLSRQPDRTHRDAQVALAQVRAGEFDCQGATHFENVGAFGTPRWAVGNQPVAVVGRHTYWAL